MKRYDVFDDMNDMDYSPAYESFMASTLIFSFKVNRPFIFAN